MAARDGLAARPTTASSSPPGTPAVPRAWYDQLAEGGLLELPLLLRPAEQAQVIITLRRHEEALRSESLLQGHFMPLRDAPGAPVPSAPVSLGAIERFDERFARWPT